MNTSRGARLMNPAANGGAPIEMRQAINDTRGEISELLGKALQRGALDQDLTPHDKERMLAFLRDYGDLTEDFLYKGSSRSGYKTLPGAADRIGVPRDPLPFGTLLDEDMWTAMLFEEGFDFQATMFQPVGGMDKIPAGLCAAARRGRPAVERGHGDPAERQGSARRVLGQARGQISRHRGRLLSRHDPAQGSQGHRGGFCAPAYAAAIGDVDYGNAIKIAWEAPRFWETEDHIYGGISWVQGPTALVWYPSDRFFAAKGILLGGYTTRDSVDELASKPLAEQFDLSRAAIDALHPGHGKDVAKPMAIAWSKVAYSLGIAARWRADQDADYALLNQPDGPFYFAGEHLSHVGAWQEGAILSARRAVNMIDAHRRAQRA